MNNKKNTKTKRTPINSEETHKEIAELYQNLGVIWSTASYSAIIAKNKIEGTKYLRKSIKNTLLAKIGNIFTEANEILEVLGKVGKVR